MSKELDSERNKDFFWDMENYELHIFHSYLTDLDKFLEKEINEYKAGIQNNQHTKWFVADDGAEYSDGNDFAIQNYQVALYESEKYRNLFLKSFIIVLFTFIESSLTKRCRNIERDNSYLLALKDLAGKGINQSMSYLIKLHRVNYSLEKSVEWLQIQNFQRLRNCIVHNGGKLDEATEQLGKLQTYVNGEANLSIEENTNEIIVTRQYCEIALLTVERFLYAIDKAISASKPTS